MKKLFLVLFLVAFAGAANAAGGGKTPKTVDWPFDGIWGKVDKTSAQRGFQVYREVCAACHGLKRISFRQLAALGFSEAEIKVLAAEYSITDGPDADGEMFDRPGKPSDNIPSPYANENQSRASNNGAYPPDLSLIVKARPNGANYLFSLLTGYETPPADVKLREGLYYNPYMPGKKIAMAPPMADGQVEYIDGTDASLQQMSKDVTNFLQWAAEPEMEQRKRMGIKVMIFLFFMTFFFYIAKKRIWSRIK